MRLLLVRHGETIENQQGLVYGHLPGVLSARGNRQILQLAETLRAEQIDSIYSSDLARCIDTAAPIINFHPKAKVRYWDLLREQDQGSYVGQLVKDVDWINLPSDVESPEQVCQRAREFISFAIDHHSEETVLLVVHRRFNNYLINVLLNRPSAYLDSQQMMYNAALSTFLISNNQVELEALNDVFHLAENTEGVS